jgi:signal transduction histidine kinase
VRERIQRQANAIARSGSRVQVRGAAPVPGRWDAFALGRIIDKLLSNAIRFGEGRPIDVAISQQGTCASIRVHDRGIGIPPDRIAAIFDRFERGVSERNYPGLGLGLYIARALLEATGGTIIVPSSSSEGTSFTVELPLATAPDAAPLS